MATDLDTLLKQFLRERKYLRNVSSDTIDWYECARKAFKGSATHCLTDPAALKRSDLDQFIYVLRDRGVKPVTCNTWLKALNAFFRWLHENGHVESRVHMRPLKVEKRLVQTLDLETIHALFEAEVNAELPVPGCMELADLKPVLPFDRRQGVPTGLRWVRVQRGLSKEPGSAPASVHPIAPAGRPLRDENSGD